MDYKGRQQRVRPALSAQSLDALLVTHLPNILYLCGFSGSAGVLVLTGAKAVFFSDGRYTAQARTEVQGARVMIAPQPPLLAAAEWLATHVRNRRRASPLRLGIEGEHLTVSARARLARILPSGFRLRETPTLVEQARMVKEAVEIRRIRDAVTLGASLFDRALELIRPGVAETEVAAEMEYTARRAGAQAMSFPTIIASGKRSALPHARASAAAIPPQGFVVCDFGVILAGYCSDRTRTVHVGRPSAEARRAYHAILRAQEAAIAAVKPGVAVSEIDRAARKLLQENGLAKYFSHSTGHGVGLEIHEAPRVAAGQTEVLRPGMVITIEPGVYLPDKWGVRIEDVVVVTERGCEVLAPTRKELIAI
ncbi:MAG TPA: Xaa-Pro peptidase family protein [Terriglobales bacterium]|nr:Xaa-Pro peptidase family protein [Terriglobales bacterium]